MSPLCFLGCQEFTCILKHELPFRNELVRVQPPSFSLTPHNLHPHRNPILGRPIPAVGPTRATRPALSPHVVEPAEARTGARGATAGPAVAGRGADEAHGLGAKGSGRGGGDGGRAAPGLTQGGEEEEEGRGVEEVRVGVVGLDGGAEERDWKGLEGSRSVGGAAESDGAREFEEGFAGQGDVRELRGGQVG